MPQFYVIRNKCCADGRKTGKKKKRTSLEKKGLGVGTRLKKRTGKGQQLSVE